MREFLKVKKDKELPLEYHTFKCSKCRNPSSLVRVVVDTRRDYSSPPFIVQCSWCKTQFSYKYTNHHIEHGEIVEGKRAIFMEGDDHREVLKF